jgi:outer membrane receptor protein involved in Fe transport
VLPEGVAISLFRVLQEALSNVVKHANAQQCRVTFKGLDNEPGETIAVTLTLRVAALEQTVVTAAKAGATDIQSTTMAISVVPGDELTRLAIRTVDQAAALVPSVTFTQNSSFGQLSIRGIGTNAVNAISSESRCCVDRKAPCTGVMPWAAR